jgi:outer membrane lipoprotein LolB
MRSNQTDFFVPTSLLLFSSRRSCLSLLAATLFIAGCSTVPVASNQQLQSTRIYAKQAEIGGRLSLRYDQRGEPQSSHGSFTWSQQLARTDVALLSPLGQTVATIAITPAMATLTQSGRTPESAPDADSLIQNVIGWPLPINGLQNWLQGFWIDRQGKRIAVTPSNDPVTITTPDNWRIHYVSWEADEQQRLRPKRIDLSRDTQQAGTVAIRIVIDTWQTR